VVSRCLENRPHWNVSTGSMGGENVLRGLATISSSEITLLDWIGYAIHTIANIRSENLDLKRSMLICTLNLSQNSTQQQNKAADRLQRWDNKILQRIDSRDTANACGCSKLGLQGTVTYVTAHPPAGSTTNHTSNSFITQHRTFAKANCIILQPIL
jgi:hypothetical protein